MDKLRNSIKYIFLVLCIITNLNLKSSYAQDFTTFINSKKFINTIDNKFISIVVDPAILMNGLNISSHTVTLAKHLSPAFVRIQGFSTSQLTFSDSDSSATKLTVTPAMWTSLNGWLISANLTPVFALSDRDRVNDAWNPKSVALPLMALADQMNTTCFWEIASDTPHKTLEQYANDVTALRHILDVFPGSRKSWGVVGGELSHCTPPPASAPTEGAEIVRKLLERIEASVDAVDWTPNSSSKINFPAKIIKTNPSISKRNPSIWTIAPRSSNPTSFKDALIWAKYLGQAASNGYNVIFRQPKVKEFFNLTPVFWVSTFHKKLVGNNVLDVHTIPSNNKKNCYVFAHCTKDKNYFENEAALTIFVVNLEETEMNISNKIFGNNLKINEMRNYILTSNGDNSSEIYLNGNLLTISDLQDRKIEFLPKQRQTKPSKSLGLNLPSKSIGFFIIPISGSSACIHGEENLPPIHPISPQRIETGSIESETDTNPASMNNPHEIIPNEEDSNEKYYKNSEFLQEIRDGNRLALERQSESKGEMNKSNKSAAGDKSDESAISRGDDITNLIIESAKQIERQQTRAMEQRATALKQLLTAASTSSSQMPNQPNLEQSSEETKLNPENFQGEEMKQTEDIDIRKKRELVSLEIPIMEMETQVRNTRKISEDIHNPASISIDPLLEYSCACKKRGHACNCGLKIATDVIQKIWNSENINPDLIKKEILNAIQLRNPTYSAETEKKKDPSDNLEEVKTLLHQYHTEIKNILKSIEPEVTAKKMDIKSSEKNELTQTKSESIENTVSQYRMKRKLSTDLINEYSKLKHLRQNTADIKWSRIKRQPNAPDSVMSELLKNHQLANNFRRRYVEDIKKLDDIKKIDDIHRSVRAIQTRKNKITASSELNITHKREILESGSDSVEDTSDDNRTTKFNEVQKIYLLDSDGDRTKEVDIFLNEISKEGKDIPNYMKQIEEDVYLVKPDLSIEESSDKMTESRSKVTQINEFIPDNVIAKSKNTSPPEVTQIKMTEIPDQESDDSSNISSEDEFLDALDTEDPSSPEVTSKDGLVDNVFRTMFDVLQDFHRKIIEYLHYLSR